MANSHWDYFTGKVVLITGGTGSFGRAMILQLLTQSRPAKVIVLSRDEWKQWEMREQNELFRSDVMRYFLGDVRDGDRLWRAFSGVDVVIHAAALKQVPAAEYNPSEFVKTNILGAMNVIEAAIARNVDRVIAISTDKAVAPANLYGATKLCSDRLFISGNVYVGSTARSRFAIVRYGNVANSRGSVVPYWQKLLNAGHKQLPITDERMTRFWITLSQATEFVARCSVRAERGAIFVPKIPSVRITDIAEALNPNGERLITGIRQGEKLHEMLIAPEDARYTRELEDCYMIIHEAYHGAYPADIGSAVAPDFVYASDVNHAWLSSEEIRATLL